MSWLQSLHVYKNSFLKVYFLVLSLDVIDNYTRYTKILGFRMQNIKWNYNKRKLIWLYKVYIYIHIYKHTYIYIYNFWLDLRMREYEMHLIVSHIEPSLPTSSFNK